MQIQARDTLGYKIEGLAASLLGGIASISRARRLSLGLGLFIALALPLVASSKVERAGLATAPRASSTPHKIAIIGAMDIEVDYLLQKMDTDKTRAHTEVFGKIAYHNGTLNGHNVVVFKSGIGKVNSAMALAIALSRYKIDRVIFTGVAGGLRKEVGVLDIVISKDMVQYDYDTRKVGGKLGHVPTSDKGYFHADRALIALAYKSAKAVLARDNKAAYKAYKKEYKKASKEERRGLKAPKKLEVFIGNIMSGDKFGTTKSERDMLRSRFDAMAIEMEGAALGQVANAFSVPLVVVRAISDTAFVDAAMSYEKFKKRAANISEQIVLEMLSRLPREADTSRSDARSGS